MSDPIERHNPRVFLDANVLYAATIGGGCAQLWRVRTIQLVTSEYAAQEAHFNLRREPDPEAARARLEELLQPPTEVVPDDGSPRLHCPWKLADEKDEPILMAAIESRCDYLLTGDIVCFGEYFGKTFDGTTILKPGKFLALLGL
jgi:predicted nucleic acid-binding protein